MRTATEKIKHCLIFSREIFYVAIVYIKYNYNIITTRPLRKHDVINTIHKIIV